MGYSKSVKAINKVRAELDQMLGSTQTITWKSSNPAKDAFAIREGINVAKQRALDGNSPHHAEYLAYASLKAKFIVRAGAGVVEAEPREIMLVPAKQVMHKQVLPNLTSDMEIVGAAITHKTPELFFPDASDEEKDLKVIYAWAQKHGYHLVSSEGGLTLTQTDPGEIAWKPARQLSQVESS